MKKNTGILIAVTGAAAVGFFLLSKKAGATPAPQLGAGTPGVVIVGSGALGGGPSVRVTPSGVQATQGTPNNYSNVFIPSSGIGYAQAISTAVKASRVNPLA